MLGFRLYSVALVCAVGLLNGCTTTTEVGVNRSGETLYLKTTCSADFTIYTLLGGLTYYLSADDLSAEDLDFKSIVVAIATGVGIDVFRCVITTPMVVNRVHGIVPPSPNMTNTPDLIDQMCLENKCGHWYQIGSIDRYNKCVALAASKDCKNK